MHLGCMTTPVNARLYARGLNMEHDDKIRAERCLAICLRDMGNGKSRIFMDDVKSDRQESPINWKHDYLYTFTPEFDSRSVGEMRLTDEEFQKIGATVVARLLALNGRVK